MNDSLDIVKAHVKETGNVHGLTLSDLGFENVENKSSADIRGELTKEDIIKALGYEPSEGNGGNGTGGSEPSNPSVTLKTFDQATNEEIIQMVKAADAGEIDLAEDCGWEVGQEHVITLPAIAASGSYDGQSWEINDSTKMQSVTLVLMENGINQTFDLVNSVKNKNGTTRNKPSFIVGLKDCVSSVLNINPSNNVGSWHNSSGRSWCNGGFRQAMESQLPNIFKQFKTITATEYNSTTNQMSIDYFSLFAEKEVFGIRTNSNETEANALKQVSYYNISNNRIKNWNGMSSKAQWALRSPNCQSTVRFCSVFVDGTAECFIVGNTVGFAPFGCI